MTAAQVSGLSQGRQGRVPVIAIRGDEAQAYAGDVLHGMPRRRCPARRALGSRGRLDRPLRFLRPDRSIQCNQTQPQLYRRSDVPWVYTDKAYQTSVPPERQHGTPRREAETRSRVTAVARTGIPLGQPGPHGQHCCHPCKVLNCSRAEAKHRQQKFCREYNLRRLA